MKKILILCPYPEGKAAGQRLKYEQYLDEWMKEDLTESQIMLLKAIKNSILDNEINDPVKIAKLIKQVKEMNK